MNKKMILLIGGALVLLAAIIAFVTVGGGGTDDPLVTESSVQTSSPAQTDTTEEADTTDTPEAEAPAATGEETRITLAGDTISVDGQGATVSGTAVTITAAGTYRVSGTLNDGQILVSVDNKADVTLILADADITYTQGAPIYVTEADTVTITLEGDNTVTDTADYVFAAGEDEPDAAIFSKGDLVFTGDGSLTVNANYNMAVHGKDDVSVTGNGTYILTAVGDGFKGKDSVMISGGNFQIVSGGDGIQSNNTDTELGFVTISGGSFHITAENDGIQAESSLTISGGDFTVTTGGGAANAPAHTESFGFPGWFDTTTTTEETTASAKGLKAGTDLTVSGGTLSIDAMDDALHCGGILTVSDQADLTIATGDDGLHADGTLSITGGVINITSCYEGLEAVFIEISGGDTTLVASDDGINAAGGTSADTDFAFTGPMGGAGMAETLETATYYAYISGGKLTVNAGGDGLDSNGALFIDGGEVYVYGPTDSGNGGLDYTTTGSVTGGTVFVSGASGMAMNFDSSSTQPSLLYVFDSNVTAGDTLTVTDEAGTELFSTTVEKTCNSVVISLPTFTVGSTYTITCGALTGEVTLTDTITSLGATGMGMGGMGGGRGGMVMPDTGAVPAA